MNMILEVYINTMIHLLDRMSREDILSNNELINFLAEIRNYRVSNGYVDLEEKGDKK